MVIPKETFKSVVPYLFSSKSQEWIIFIMNTIRTFSPLYSCVSAWLSFLSGTHQSYNKTAQVAMWICGLLLCVLHFTKNTGVFSNLYALCVICTCCVTHIWQWKKSFDDACVGSIISVSIFGDISSQIYDAMELISQPVIILHLDVSANYII